MNLDTSNNFLTIQLRYCFDSETMHSMNAEVFNECERQFIKAIKSTEKYFEETLEIRVNAREKGSLIDKLTIIFNTPLFGAVVGIFANKFFDSNFSSAKHKTDETSKKLENILLIKEQIKLGNLTEDDFDYIASNDKDLRKQKNIFFKSVKKDTEIQKIETTTIYNSNSTIVAVERKDFDSFLFAETTETTETTSNEKIFIVAPVLIQGKKSSTWRGILNDQPIEFKISDKEFLQQVYGKQVTFSNGTFINCEIKITSNTNIETDEIKYFREVINVFNFGEDIKSLRSIQHRKKINKQETTFQLKMFDENSFSNQ